MQLIKLLVKNFFKDLNEHDAEHEAVTKDMHSTQLIKMLANDFFTIRLQRYGQLYTEKVFKKSMIGLRQQSNKLITFKGL